ncbi:MULTISPECIES: BppU family phage baseplate upper protein [Fructobacillus]|uniref:BppU N-terminal domain-containing protein n=2 Tax=Fructobacillus cardui TaxID=2893170 RepID=A0ABM9MRX4_9LACO|nr:BppU family phage baseplate upper protein [Fructobacillus sp. EFB-N1]KMK52937.1 hypothetical protein FEFB_13530 [Fructobacillus sp. EFB-N1]CAK1235692.1 hypothetical protein R82641_BJNNKPBH_00516 [Fructobacillus cardui]
MARTYAELNTNLNTNQSTLVDQLNGRQGDANREVFFQIKDGTSPFNLEGKTIALFAKDAQGVIKATSTINDQTGISVGRFSMIIPKEFYQASGAVEDAYIQISYSDKVISTIPVSFQVIANTMIVTQTQSQIFIDSVQSLIDDTNQRLSTTTTSLTSVENAVEALKVTIGNLNDQYNSDLFAKKANDNEFKGVNTFDQKIVAPNGLQGKADSATQADNATHANSADSAKNADVANSLNPANNQTVNDLTVNGNLKVNPRQKVYHAQVTLQPNLQVDLYRIGTLVKANFGGRGVTISPWSLFDGSIPVGFRPSFGTSIKFVIDANLHDMNLGEDGRIYNRWNDGNNSGGTYHDADGSDIWFTKDDYPE